MIPSPSLPGLFIDSSVLFAAALSPNGRARDLIKAGASDEIQLVISHIVLVETERNLAAKAPRGLAGLANIREAQIFTISEPERSMVLEIARNIELKDAAIVAGALAAQATFLATDDRKHRLSQSEELLSRHALIVATPDDILAAMKK